MRGLKRTGVVAALAAVAVGLIVPATSAGAVLYDQTGTSVPSIASSLFSPSNDHDAQAADDFTVPAGQRWRITSVDVNGSTRTGHAGNVAIFAGGGAAPGSVLFQQGSLFFASAHTVSLSVAGAPVLEPGSYWLSVFTTAFTLNQADGWSWSYQSAPQGQPAVWRNPGDGFTTGCTTFKPLTQCVSPSVVSLQFRLNGDIVPPSAPAKKCKKKPKKHRGAASAKKKRCKKPKKK